MNAALHATGFSESNKPTRHLYNGPIQVIVICELFKEFRELIVRKKKFH